jgi:hypothetical protein
VVLLSLSGALSLGVAAQSEVTLKYKAIPKFDLILPGEQWTDGTSGIPIAHRGGDRFDVDVELLTARVDTDGDGKLDATVKGLDGYTVLSGKRPDGSPLSYAVRLRVAPGGNKCEYATSGAMVGAIEGVPVQLIDQNNNGLYNEAGVDAMVVGSGRAASFLSKVVNVKGKLMSIEVDSNGTTIKATPYSGASGTLSVRRGLKLLGDLHAAVVSDSAQGYSFEVGAAQDGLRVPVGSYVFSGGFASKGGDTAKLRAGKMNPMVVKDGATTTTQWGAPLVAEFNYTRDGEQLTVQPKVAFIGRGGEEWHALLPDAKSPKLLFYDKDNDKLIATKRFEGC